MLLQLRCAYRPELAGGVGRPRCEVFPIRMHAFGTHELKRDRPSATLLFGPELADAEQRPLADIEFNVTIEWRGVQSVEHVFAPLRRLGAYRFEEVDRLFEPGKISRAARVVFNAYARSMNPEGQQCWVRAGSVPFDILQLRKTLTGEQVAFGLVQNAVDVDPSVRRTGDVIRTDAPLVKGSLTITAASLLGGSLDDFDRSLLPAQQNFDMLSLAELRNAAAEMSMTIDRHMGTFFGPQAKLGAPSIAPLIRFHDPVSLKDQLVMASLGYCLNRSVRPPPLAYFLKALRVVSARRGLSVAELTRIGNRCFSSGPMPKRAESFAFYSYSIAIVALFANSLIYIEDFDNKNKAGEPWLESLVEGDEDNKIARVEGADDCEGLALEIFMLAVDLYLDSDSVIGAADSAEVALLRLVVRLLRLYVPGMMFGAVTNAKMTYDSAASSMTADNTMAHTYTCYLPFNRFVEMQSTETLEILGQSPRFTYDQALLDRLDLPTLIGEGTALVDATMQPIESYYAADDPEAATAISLSTVKSHLIDTIHQQIDGTRLQTEMIACERLDASLLANRRDLSGFYKWANGFTTSLFADTRLLDFAFYYQHPGGPPDRTYGVTFNDLLLRNPARPKIGLLPTIRLTKREAAVIDNIMALDEPVPCILAAVDTDNVPPAIRSAVEQLRVRRREPTSSTAIHRARFVVSTRLQDVGERELQALQNLANLGEWAAIDTEFHRIARVDDPNLEPIDVLDVVFQY